MTVVSTRLEFEQLLELRLREAKLLLDNGYWDGSYYLSGYVVEFALKVRIISRLVGSNSYPDKSSVDKYFKHDLTKLRELADLEAEMDSDPAMGPHWSLVKDWNEQSRYGLGKAEKDARDLYNAIEKEVLPWIKSRW